MLNEIVGSVVQLLLFSLIPVLVWVITARKKESFFTWIGLKKPVCPEAGKTLGLTLLATAGYIAAMLLSIRILPEGVTTAGSQFAGQGLSMIPAAVFYAFVRTALSEEIVFRGFLLKRLQSRFGFVSANTIQAVLFGMLHGIPFFLVTRSVGSLLLLTLLPALFGWFEGWLNEKRCDGSIVPSWILHGCVNLVTTILSL
ncbi:MAG: CPBP family intramembrane metalloprotease [Lachnospiraceae bacterium]|nr:CPBP family intramembrane metalloprotease [Lachnospiraceae bacterium]